MKDTVALGPTFPNSESVRRQRNGGQNTVSRERGYCGHFDYLAMVPGTSARVWSSKHHLR